MESRTLEVQNRYFVQYVGETEKYNLGCGGKKKHFFYT